MNFNASILFVVFFFLVYSVLFTIPLGVTFYICSCGLHVSDHGCLLLLFSSIPTKIAIKISPDRDSILNSIMSQYFLEISESAAAIFAYLYI